MKAVLLLLLLATADLLADCSWMPRQSTQFRTTALDVAAEGEFVWVATGYGVQLMEAGRVIDTVAIPGLTRTVLPAANGYVYAGSGARVYALRRDGRAITVTGAATASGTVNALAIAGDALFAGTTAGIDHFDLVTPAAPQKRNTVLRTSSSNVTSLAVSRTMLFAADGDTSVEMFSIASPSQPQAIGAIDSSSRAAAVHVADELLYVSDPFGRNTEVYSGTSRLARLPVGSNSLASLAPRLNVVAGTDRTLRLVDFSVTDRTVEYLELQLSPTNGTDNSIHAIARAGSTIYVAAGDIGVATVDTSSLTRPFAHVSYSTTPTLSVRAFANKAYFADAAGTLSELRLDPNGIALIQERAWTAPAGTVVQDARNNGLVTSAGPDLTLWALVSNPPVAAVTAKLVTDITAAVAADAYLVALLANGSVYTVATAQPTPQKVVLPPMALLTRSGSAIAMAEIREEEAKTVIHYWPTGNLSTAARTFTVDGAAVGSVALDATRAAVFTFNGISVVDLATGAVHVIAGSNAILPRQLAFAGDDLLALDGRRLHVFDDARTLVRSQPLASDALGVDLIGSVAVLATAEGVAAVSHTRALPLASAKFRNNYYTKVVAAGDRVYLFEKSGIDIFSSTNDALLRYAGGINAPGAIDLAAGDTGVFTLSANGTVASWSRAGTVLNQKTLDEGPDTQPLAIDTVRGAVWVAISTGCSAGACNRRTLVLDPVTLAVTATLPGAARDVVVSGNRAYAFFDAPNELRVYDVTNAIQPAQLLATPRPTVAMSIAYESGRIHLLGDKLYTYSESSLALVGERFAGVVPDGSHRIHIAEGCAIVSGRTEHPELYSLPSFTASIASEVPSSVRSVASVPSRLYLLTAHSLEIWSTLPPTNTREKRRSLR